MSDIVERLRKGIVGNRTADEAADEIERLRASNAELVKVLDTCAIPTPEQIEQMETGFGTIYTPRMALELGMKTAIGNVKRAAIEKANADHRSNA